MGAEIRVGSLNFIFFSKEEFYYNQMNLYIFNMRFSLYKKLGKHKIFEWGHEGTPRELGVHPCMEEGMCV